MIDFGKVWQAMVFINIAILMANFAGVFPEQWTPYLKSINDTYNQIQTELQQFQNINEQDLLLQAGSYGYIMILGIKLVIQLVLLAPVYVGDTLNNIIYSLGIPAPLGSVFTVITYFSFALWIVDIIRGRWVNDVY